MRSDVELDAWVVMPNHFHGILLIKGRDEVAVGGPVRPSPGRLLSDSLGSIVGQIKSMCTKRVRDMGEADFAWQPRYHDHIIRDEAELFRIREYIVGNPGKWCEDQYYAPEP